MAAKIKTFRNDNRKDELKEILENHFLASLATRSGESVEIAIIFYAFNGDVLYFKSRTESSHSRNISIDNKVSLSIYSHESNYEAKYGVQLKGNVEQITDIQTMKEAVELYSAKFQGAGAKLPSIEDLCSPEIKSTFYKFSPTKFKIIDEDKETNRAMLEYHTY